MQDRLAVVAARHLVDTVDPVLYVEAYAAVAVVADVSSGYAILTAALLAASGAPVAYLVSRMMRHREFSLVYRLAWIGLPLFGLMIVWCRLFLLAA